MALPKEVGMRAKPLFTYGLVAGALAALSGGAQALGLGRLTVDSALGQPLSARIELTSVSRDELDTLSARIADPTLYRQNNLTYQGVLARTRVTLDYVGGQPYLRIASVAPVNEPFLDLMVELNWASGRVVREYTFLLDPPGMATAAVAEPITPARTGAARLAPQAPAATPASPVTPSVGAAGARTGGDEYTVQAGDTLAKIAGQVKPNDVSLEQMLVALLRNNAAAFDDNNMNRLRRGAILKIPGAQEAAATDPAEATRVVRTQAADWRAYRDRVAATAPSTEAAGTRGAAGQIGTARADATPAAPPGRDQLKVSPALAGKGTTAEEQIARDNQLRDAQARIAELEKTIKDLQRMLEIRSPTMAQAQVQAEAATGKAPEAAAPEAPAAAPPPPVAAAAPPPPVAAAAPASPAPVAAAPEPAKAAAEAPKAPEPAPPPEPAKSAEPAKAPAPAAPTPAKAKEPPGFFEDFFGNMPGWAMGLGGLAIIGGIGAIVAARRRKATKFEDSIISGTDIKTNTVFGSTGGGVVNTGENSLASDFSREGLGNIDTDEVDPIAEAEVYLAYGRDAQAEEILKDALKKDPQRQEIYLKLLEIHAQHNKPSAFETVATELFAVCGGQGETWQKAVALGRQLDPTNPMFGEAGMAALAGGAAAAPVAGGAPGSGEHRTEPTLDRMIDEDITVTPSSGAKARVAGDVFAAMPELDEMTGKDKAASPDSSLESIKSSAAAATVALADALAASKSTLESKAADLAEKVDSTKEPAKFDLDFHLDDADKPAPLKPKDVPSFAESTAQAAATPAAQLARPAAALELDKLDLSFDPDRTTFEDPTPSVLDGQWHDAATKLDLAKAYQEMGDVEGAREILQEVLHEGDDQQKTEAQALLAKLG
jgi:pilus assembly protein FimV